MRVVVLVPRRAGIADRDRIWSFCRAWWENDHPDWTIIEGDDPGDGPYNRSRALNLAAREAGEWDVAVIIDADVLVGAEAVRVAVERAVETGGPILAYSDNNRLSSMTTSRILNGWRGDWSTGILQVFSDMCSSVVVVTRGLWNEVGGFDEGFVGWGYEDNAFMAACETLSGRVLERRPGCCWHLYHRTQKRIPALIHANRARLGEYARAYNDPFAMRLLLDRPCEPTTEIYREPTALIPRILHRTVPERTTAQVESFWQRAEQLHPGWEFKTYRDPLPITDWPLSAHLWNRCQNGAQKAGLIRLEALIRLGGVYIDSDVELYRPLDSLRFSPAFAAWEDAKVIPDAVLGCIPGHPAFVTMLDEALELVGRGAGAWDSGPGVSTRVLRGRPDVLLLPPGSFYPYHYREKHRAQENHAAAQPWAFGAHHWAASWVPA